MKNNLNQNLPNSRQVVAIGLEAADPDLIEKWCNEGHLPVLSSLIEKGSWCKLVSNTEISSGATWASLITGTSAAKHGMGFYHRQLKNGTYEIVKKYADEMHRKPFWTYLNKNKKIVVFDIPVTYPLKNINGIQIVGWGAEGLNWKQSSMPPEILDSIISKFGRHPLQGWYQKVIKDINEWKTLKHKLIEGVKTRTSIAKWLLEKDKWDFALIGFAEMHWAGHYFWHLTDKEDPGYNVEIAEVCGTAILDIYKEVDKSIGQLINNYSDSTLMIFSNTGIGPNYSGQHLVPQILKKLGMTSNNSKAQEENIIKKMLPAQRWGPYAIKKIEKIVSANSIEKVKKIIPTRLWDKWTRKFLTIGNNWKNSRAFMVPTDFTGAIRINLKGREPNGIVDPSKYDSICAKLISEFNSLINTKTGKNAVTEVIKVREKYKGEFVNDLPDLIVKWEGKNTIFSLSSPSIGTISGTLPDKRTGAHTTYGFLIACNSPIKSSNKLPHKNILDIAPTILYFLGEEAPADFDGEILSDMIVDDFKYSDPIKT